MSKCKVAILLSLLLCALQGLQADDSGAVSLQPNMVIVLADDQGWRDSGAYGNPDVLTPNIDRLASEGMAFTHAFTATAMCAPTRQQLYTGLYPVHSGAYPQNSFVRADVRSIPHYFSEIGYRVGISGKRHYAPAANYPFESLNAPSTAFDKEAPEMDRISEFVHRDPKQPFFLVVASRQPHTPWNKGDFLYEPTELTVPENMVDTPETRQALASYYREVSDFDRELGEVLAIVEQAGQTQNTLFIYTSEQGAMFPDGKWTLYDNGIRTAFIARWPGVIEAGSTSDALVAYVDVVPTLIELAGSAKPEVDGRSFAAVIKGDKNMHRDYVFGVHTNLGICNGVPYPIRSVRDQRFKLIVNGLADQQFRNNITERDPSDYFESWRQAAEAGDQHALKRVSAYEHRPELELYDVVNDPLEINNLATDARYASELERLRSALMQWQETQGDAEMQLTEAAAKQRILLPGLAKLSTPKCTPRE